MDPQKWRTVQLLHRGRGGRAEQGQAELQNSRVAGHTVPTDEEEVEPEDQQPVAAAVIIRASGAYFQTEAPVQVAVAH